MNNPDYLISTPENVDLHLELAGMGNRVIAASVDAMVIIAANCIIVAIIIGAGALTEMAHYPTEVKNSIYFWGICVASLLMFFIIFGYFVFFEGTWKGQTPGKRLTGIRVIEANGQPIGWTAVFIRNLMRLVDCLPGMYAGILPMLFDKSERRFGDMAAGTIVIRERLQSFTSELQILDNNAASDIIIDTGQISPEAYHLLVGFLKRRKLMVVSDRERLSADMAKYFQTNMGILNDSDNSERFIEKLFIAYRKRADLELLPD